MAECEKILRLIFEVVEELNESLPVEEHIACSDDTAILGEDAGLDSLSLLNLVLGVETRLAETLGGPQNLADVLVGGDAEDPPATLGELARFIVELEGQA